MSSTSASSKVKRSASSKSRATSSNDTDTEMSTTPRASSTKKKTVRTKKRSADDDAPAAAASASSSAAPAHPYSHQQYQLMKLQPSEIQNKMKRKQMWLKVKAAKEDVKSKERKKRKKDIENGVEVTPAKKQKTLDNTREADETIVQANDEEVQQDESMDEFSSYFNGEVEPKIVITSCYKPTKKMYEFIRDLLYVFPNSFYYKRSKYSIKQITEASKKRGYTDLIIINEDHKTFNGLTHIHLPEGPTAYYKLTNVVLCRDIEGHGRTTSHQPEVILNNFNTRLGHRVGRMLGSLFHQVPEFVGRRVVTFHNQRDFIFFRHHRYIFDTPKSQGGEGDEEDEQEDKESLKAKSLPAKATKARLQQLGPKFTLKLQWLQHGVFDSQHGEMEWLHKKEMDTSRRRFFL